MWREFIHMFTVFCAAVAGMLVGVLVTLLLDCNIYWRGLFKKDRGE